MSDEGQELKASELTPKPLGSVLPTPEALVFEGGPASGKTQALISRICTLIDGGVDSAQVLAFSATPDAARAFKARLLRACPQAEDVRVVTPREWFLEVLGDSEAKMATGRDARLLAPFECNFLVEDLKTSGLHTRRLREMLKFFCKSMTELADDEAGEWLVTDEEAQVYRLLKDCLGFTRGIIEPELANLTVRYLQGSPTAKERARVAHLVVDDYQMLSRASQMAANLVACESIAIAVDPEGCLEVFESYPYADGLAEFLEANPIAKRESLSVSYSCEAGARSVNRLRADLGTMAEPMDVQFGFGGDRASDLMAADPSGEMGMALSFVAQLIADGMAPDDIVVASPHRTWTLNLARALEGRGIPTEMAFDENFVSGDSQNDKKCAAARVLTGLYLVADCSDGVAWRSWCGFGDDCASARVVRGLRDFAGERGASIGEALGMAELQASALTLAGTASNAPNLAEAYAAGLAMIQQAKSLAGRALLEFLACFILGEGSEIPAPVLQLAAEKPEDVLDNDAAAVMAQRARSRLAAPAFECEGRVRITTYERMAGLSPKVLLLCGFVNGLFPHHDYFVSVDTAPGRAKLQRATDTRLMAQIAGKPTELLAVSRFEQVPLGAAEMLGLKLRRVVLRDKKRVALAEPSDYLTLLEMQEGERGES